jgi:predicted nucleic acid-binding protein
MTRYAYLDASAIVKLIVAEPETAALERDLADRAGLFCSRLGAAEVIRAARRRANRRVLQQTDDVLDALVLMEVTPPILKRAAELAPEDLRTLDAIHLATALSVGIPDLDFLTYDRRLADAAKAHGLGVLEPGVRP